MKKIILSTSLVAIFALTLNLQAKNSPVTLTTKSYKEVMTIDDKGNRHVVLQKAKKIVPGDYVVYKNSIKNNGNKSVKGMVLNNPVPLHTEYIANSARCSDECDILFSVDGGKKFAKPENLMIKEGNSNRLALAKEYTNVRWILTSALAANSTTEVSFKTKLQ